MSRRIEIELTSKREDGTWTFDVPSPAAGQRGYAVRGPDGTELGTVSATVAEADANASAAG